ncbi:MAG: class I SAM-dependent methyltransferase [Xanthomonadales bacterium]|nr:class I SAM-dependent methyltransferase [Xanthomonadales bacterium]
MFSKIRQLLRLGRAADPGLQEPDSSDAEAYAERLQQEQQTYRDCENVHELPEIFHYWSNRYLRPQLERFGFSHPDQFYSFYCRKAFDYKGSQRPLRIASIGSGNCDTEVRLAQALNESGIIDFHIECLDINQQMLDRGRELAEDSGVQVHIVPLRVDFNNWQPEGRYDVIMANQSLHHVVELERLFDAIKGSLTPGGRFLTADMIGRNGHQRWPEALDALEPFWDELPDAYRFNRLLQRQEQRFMNHDCSGHGFEGIRAQDILPLLIQRFEFELFIPFANLVTVLIDRPFGHNFDAAGEWDRDYIDRLHAADEEGFLSGRFKPTQMFAVLRNEPQDTLLVDPRLTPEFCVRQP